MVTWNSDADARLFLAILAEHNIKVNFKNVADRFGQGATPRAISERLGKLKAKAAASGFTASGGDDSSGNDNGASGRACAPNTPKKRKNQKVLDGGISKSPAKRMGGNVKPERFTGVVDF